MLCAGAFHSSPDPCVPRRLRPMVRGFSPAGALSCPRCPGVCPRLWARLRCGFFKVHNSRGHTRRRGSPPASRLHFRTIRAPPLWGGWALVSALCGLAFLSSRCPALVLAGRFPCPRLPMPFSPDFRRDDIPALYSACARFALCSPATLRRRLCPVFCCQGAFPAAPLPGLWGLLGGLSHPLARLLYHMGQPIATPFFQFVRMHN